jgi:hypothetical protein
VCRACAHEHNVLQRACAGKSGLKRSQMWLGLCCRLLRCHFRVLLSAVWCRKWHLAQASLRFYIA